MARFSAKDAAVVAELSNGQIVECFTSLKAEGSYREWHESAPCEWMSGWTESESDIDEDTIAVYDADEFETDEPVAKGLTIVRLIKVIDDPDWEVIEPWYEEDYEIA